jgi:hypothetical protein
VEVIVAGCSQPSYSGNPFKAGDEVPSLVYVVWVDTMEQPQSARYHAEVLKRK